MQAINRLCPNIAQVKVKTMILINTRLVIIISDLQLKLLLFGYDYFILSNSLGWDVKTRNLLRSDFAID